MKTFLKLSALSLALVSISSNSYSATATGNVTATVSAAITVFNVAGGDLAFGRFVADTSPSRIIVSPAGVRTVDSGSPTLIPLPSPTAGLFTVGGDANATYSITLPSSATLTSGSNNMTADTFTSTPSGTGTISGGGTQNLNVGARLLIGASQPVGNYTGTYTITVAYN